ncbi:MAG: hypothetical protein JXR44_08400 [Thiotrichales bacterium]|nr:hypothetical protein [Thiotrichales bacterium]
MKLLWLHDEALGLLDEMALAQMDVQCFVWDSDYFAAQGWSFKRQVFLYESLVALPKRPELKIVHGRPLMVLEALQAQSATPLQITTFAAQNPLLQQAIEQVERAFEAFECLPTPRLLSGEQQAAPKRFFHYWQLVEHQLTGRRSRQTRQRPR